MLDFAMSLLCLLAFDAEPKFIPGEPEKSSHF